MPAIVLRALVLLAALSSCGCTGLAHMTAGIERVRRIVREIDCQDGAPAKLIIDPHCLDGICGVTCAPERWRQP